MLFRSRSLPVGVCLLHTTRTLKCALSQSVTSSTPLALSSAPSPSQHIPPQLIPFHSQVRSLPFGVFLPYSFPSTLKCALSQSVSSSPTHSFPLSSALSPSLHLSPQHRSHPIKCALSQLASPTSTPLPPYQMRSLPVGISVPHASHPLKCAL